MAEHAVQALQALLEDGNFVVSSKQGMAIKLQLVGGECRVDAVLLRSLSTGWQGSEVTLEHGTAAELFAVVTIAL